MGDCLDLLNRRFSSRKLARFLISLRLEICRNMTYRRKAMEEVNDLSLKVLKDSGNNYEKIKCLFVGICASLSYDRSLMN